MGLSVLKREAAGKFKPPPRENHASKELMQLLKLPEVSGWHGGGGWWRAGAPQVYVARARKNNEVLLIGPWKRI